MSVRTKDRLINLAVIAVIVALWVIVPVQAHAQDAPAQQVDAVTVTGQRETYKPSETSSLGVDLPAQQTPAAITVLTDEFLRDLGAKRLDDTLNFITGVTYNDNGGETGESPLIRGFGATATYIDGVRTTARYGIPRLKPDTLERIEVIKGPAGAEAGVADFGGTISLITKKPQRAFAASGNIEAGDYGYRKLATDVTGALDGNGVLQGRLIAAYEEDASWRKGRPDKVPSYVIAPSLLLKYSDNSSLLVQYEKNYVDSPQDRGIIYLQGAFEGGAADGFAPRDWSFHQSTSSQEREFDRLSLDWNQVLTAQWSVRARLQEWREKRALREFRNADSEPGGALYNEDGLSWNGERNLPIFYDIWNEHYKTRSWLAETKGTFKLGAVDNTVRLGADGSTLEVLPGTDFASLSNNNSVDIVDPVNNQAPVDLEVLGSPTASSGEETRRSVYGTWLAHWTPRLRTMLSVRRDRFTQNFEDTQDGVVQFTSASSANTTSTRAALSFDLTPAVSVFAGFSNAFQPQSGITRDGAPLEPTGGTSFEAGVKASLWGGRALWSTTAYQIEQDNIAACDNDPSLTQDDIDRCRYSVLLGSVRIRGIETELQGRVTDNLSLSAGAALMQSRITQTDQIYSEASSRAGETFAGNRFANTPKWQLNAAASYLWAAIGLPQLHTFAAVAHVGQRWGNNGNTISLPAYTVLNAGVRYQLTPTLAASLNINNLLDETYYTAMQGSGDVADQISVGERRLVRAGFNMQF
jgi:iron complex outermembrane recepter protein